MRRNKETHNFIHPQALPHPPTTSPRDFAGYTRFYIYRNLIFLLKVKDKKKYFISEKTVSLKTLITSLSFFVSDLKYQMKVLSVELHQSYSWSQDRRSLEYWVENQKANWLIATLKKNPWMKRKITLSLKYCLKHKI